MDFPHVGQVFCIKREFTNINTKVKSTETVYGITSLTADKATAGYLLELNRGHWSIENSLHYVRDVTFDEDRSQIRTKNAPQVMSTLRSLAISLFRWFGKTNIAKTLRMMAAKPHLALHMLRL